VDRLASVVMVRLVQTPQHLVMQIQVLAVVVAVILRPNKALRVVLAL
jgi:hypothetical protein